MQIFDVASTSFIHHDVAFKIDYFLSDKEVWGQGLTAGHLWLVVLITSNGKIVERFKFDEPLSILRQPIEVIHVIAVRQSKTFLDELMTRLVS